jgi:hypothetical protein
MSLRRYLGVFLTALPLIGYMYFLGAVLYSNLNIPNGMPFTLRTTLPITVACLLGFTSVLASLPRTENYIRSKRNISRIAYIFTIILPILISLIFAYISVMNGGLDYTAFQAQL